MNVLPNLVKRVHATGKIPVGAPLSLYRDDDKFKIYFTVNSKTYKITYTYYVRTLPNKVETTTEMWTESSEFILNVKKHLNVPEGYLAITQSNQIKLYDLKTEVNILTLDIPTGKVPLGWDGVYWYFIDENDSTILNIYDSQLTFLSTIPWVGSENTLFYWYPVKKKFVFLKYPRHLLVVNDDFSINVESFLNISFQSAQFIQQDSNLYLTGITSNRKIASLSISDLINSSSYMDCHLTSKPVIADSNMYSSIYTTYLNKIFCITTNAKDLKCTNCTDTENELIANKLMTSVLPRCVHWYSLPTKFIEPFNYSCTSFSTSQFLFERFKLSCERFIFKNILREGFNYFCTNWSSKVIQPRTESFDYFYFTDLDGSNWGKAKSTNNLTISIEIKTLKIKPKLFFEEDQSILIFYDLANYMTGTVRSYDKTTGDLIVDILSISGSGSYDTWLVYGTCLWSKSWNEDFVFNDNEYFPCNYWYKKYGFTYDINTDVIGVNRCTFLEWNISSAYTETFTSW